jgi:PAS domain S-box-containing protein
MQNSTFPTVALGSEPAKFRRKLILSVLLPLLLMVLLAGLFLWQISQLIEATNWVDHTDEVISQANITQRLLVDQETGLRGYLITAEPEFLAPYINATEQLTPSFANLKSLVQDNPPQSKRVDEILSLHGEWTTYAREMIAVKNSGNDYQSRIRSSEGKRRMDSMRELFTAFIKSEEQLRNERAQSSRRAAQLATRNGTVAALALGILIAFYVRRQLVSVSRSYGKALTAERNQSQWLSTTLSSIGDAVIVTDGEGRVLMINPVATSVTGWTTSDAAGRFLPEVFRIVNEETRAEVENPVTKVLRAGTIVGLANHTVLISKTGIETPIDDSGAPIKDSDGNIIGVVLVFRDITERKLAEEQREQLLKREQAARHEAEQANHLKDEFLATASHELRTPLTSIVGWTRMLRSRRLDSQTSNNALESIERNTDSLMKLIEDLLDTSRIMSGKLLLDMHPIEIGPVIENAVGTVGPAAQAKNITIRIDLEQAGAVLGDANRLQQVVWNLLSNAVKFTPKSGQIAVKLSRFNSQVEVSVSDSGEGIETEFLPFVFDRFRQADGSKTRKHGGLGLGLAIVRNLVEMHGGTVKADSEGPGKGATFSVRLPLLAVYRKKISPPSTISIDDSADPLEMLTIECPPKLDGLRVLVVDDDGDTLEMLRTVLAQCEADVITVSSAGDAWREIERRRPDVLVSDIGMPKEDGYELIRRSRESESETSEAMIPALALTAYAKAEDRVRALSAGYQMHLAKPVEPAELVLVVASLVGRDDTEETVQIKHSSSE